MSNVFSFVGTVGRDAETRVTKAGPLLSVTVACNTGFGDKRKTLWVSVALFGKRAEGQFVDLLKKGTNVYVSGELSQNEYQASDGTTKTQLQVNANILDIVGKREEGQAAQSTPKAQAPAKSKPADFDEDIPF
jgi:single-strand DNA-binding protein